MPVPVHAVRESRAGHPSLAVVHRGFLGVQPSKYPDLRLSGELLVAETYVPNWTTSPSYPPSDVIDPARRIQAGHPALVDMTSKYPDLYGDYAYCAAEHRSAWCCRWRGDGAEQDAAGVPHRWQAVAWINGRHFGQNGPLAAAGPTPSDDATAGATPCYSYPSANPCCRAWYGPPKSNPPQHPKSTDANSIARRGNL